MKKKLHTTKVVAQYLDLSERRVRQLRDEGVLEEKAPAYTICVPASGGTSTTCGATRAARLISTKSGRS